MVMSLKSRRFLSSPQVRPPRQIDPFWTGSPVVGRRYEEVPNTLIGRLVLVVSTSSTAEKAKRRPIFIASHYNRKDCALDTARRIGGIRIRRGIAIDRHTDVPILCPGRAVIPRNSDVRASISVDVADIHLVVGIDTN